MGERAATCKVFLGSRELPESELSTSFNAKLSAADSAAGIVVRHGSESESTSQQASRKPQKPSYKPQARDPKT